MIELLRTTQIAFSRFATPSGFLVGSGDDVQKAFVPGSVQGKIVCNHFGEHRFSVADPRVFSPPTLLRMMTEIFVDDRNYN